MNLINEKLLYISPVSYLHVNKFINDEKSLLFAKFERLETKNRSKVAYFFLPKNKIRIMSPFFPLFVKNHFLLETENINENFIIAGKTKIKNNKFTFFISGVYRFEEKERINNFEIFPLYKKRDIRESYLIAKKVHLILEQYKIKNIIFNKDEEKRKKMFSYLHFPKEKNDYFVAQRYFFYERSFFEYITFSLKNRVVYKINNFANVIEIIERNLEIKLNENQKKQISKYKQSLEKNNSRILFLLGEVGSGKTFTFLSFALFWLKNNFSVVCISPTSLLNEQTFEKAYNLKKENINVQKISKETDYSEIGLFFSTTKIFYCGNIEKVKNLGLIIVDEEHKFGIQSKLLDKVNIIYSTATPIPRLVNLSLHNYINTLHLKREKQYDIETKKIKISKINKKIIELHEKSEKVLIIAPYIKERKANSVAINSIEQVEKILNNLNINFLSITGKQDSEVQKNNISKFINLDMNFLTATQVVEIGINIPGLKTMIIFGQEYFGLSQLHQFRGRIGRNGEKSFCYIVENELNILQYKRLITFCNIENSISLSKWDSVNRGYGNISGKEQKGKDIFFPISENDKNYLNSLTLEQLNFFSKIYNERYTFFYKNLNKKILPAD